LGRHLGITARAPPPPVQRSRLALLRSPGAAALLVLLFTLISKAGEALAPRLAQSSPLLLLALNANDALCALAGPRLPAPLYYAVVLLRRGVEDGAFFAVGWRHGDAALTSLERAAPGAASAFRAAVARLASAPLLGLAALAVWPAAPCHLAAGAARTPPLAFVLVTVCSAAVRAAALRAVGAHASPLLAELLAHPAVGVACAAGATLSLALTLRPLLAAAR
jgi:hypothetical protein